MTAKHRQNSFPNVALALLSLGICATLSAENTGLRTVRQDHECFQHQQVTCGSTLNDTLNIYGCAYQSGEYFNTHMLTASAGVQVSVLMHSRQFMPFIQVMGSDFNYPVVWDRSPSASESRVTFTTPYAGKFYILAGGERPYATTPVIGTYALAVTCAGGGTPAPVGCTEIDIWRDPQNSVIPAGTTATLDVQHSGTPPFTYRWFYGESGDESRLVGTSQTYTTQPLSATATYWVRVLNGCSVAASQHATIFTTCTGPTITAQPQSRTAPYRSSVEITVTASGSPPLTYEWYEQPNRLISSGPVPTLNVVQVTRTRSFFVVARNSCGSATSQVATITVLPPARRRAVKP